MGIGEGSVDLGWGVGARARRGLPQKGQSVCVTELGLSLFVLFLCFFFVLLFVVNVADRTFGLGLMNFVVVAAAVGDVTSHRGVVTVVGKRAAVVGVDNQPVIVALIAGFVVIVVVAVVAVSGAADDQVGFGHARLVSDESHQG